MNIAFEMFIKHINFQYFQFSTHIFPSEPFIFRCLVSNELKNFIVSLEIGVNNDETENNFYGDVKNFVFSTIHRFNTFALLVQWN